MYDEQVPVLIVGGGSVGLTASLFLSRLGIPSLLVERHSGTSIHPRARGLNYRTLELFRTVGLEEAIRQAGSELAGINSSILVRTIVEGEIRRFGGLDDTPESRERLAQLTPTSWCFCAQDELEPLLVDAARTSCADIRFNTELASFEQDFDGVIAYLTDRTTGRQYTVRAAYLLATDGAKSPIRQKLGLAMTGRGTIGHYTGIYFRADLSNQIKDHEFITCFVKNPEAPGTISNINNRDRWVFNVEYDPSDGTTAASFTPERCLELVRTAVGLPELQAELLSVLPWEAAINIAERYRVGRVFLAGDAAHVMPPAGAFGLNTGIQDVHNLAWKLAAVINGSASPKLLDSYEAERYPVGKVTVEQAGIRLDFRGSGRPPKSPAPADGPTMIDDMVMIFGQHYHSSSIIGERSESAFLDNLEALGQPGSRAPHTWLGRNGQRLSSLDMFNTSYVLLTGVDGNAWCDAASTLADQSNLELKSYRIGNGGDFEDLDKVWGEKYRITLEGAVLVRPDGFVAWKSDGSDQNPAEKLKEVFHQISGQNS